MLFTDVRTRSLTKRRLKVDKTDVDGGPSRRAGPTLIRLFITTPTSSDLSPTLPTHSRRRAYVGLCVFTGKGVLEISILCYNLSFVHFFTNVEANVRVFEVNESILKGFEKIGHFVFMVFPKNVVLCTVGREGAFVDARETVCSFDDL